jgi:tetratricopeptide (TPR) repeat protein
MAIQPEHRSILVVDIEEFSRRERTNPIQLDLHRDLRGLLQDALQAGEINQDVCEWEDRGDGFLITIGAEVPKSRLLDPVIPLLAERVEAHNRTAEPAWRLRLRVVVHAGEVLRDPKANVGQAVVAACRLLDSPELHAHLKATSRPLVVAVSDWIYQEIVQHGYGSIDRATYRRMPFTSKNTIDHAWVHIPDDPTAPAAATSTRRRPPRTPHQPTRPHEHTSEPLDTDAQEEAAIPADLPGDIPSFTGRSKELKTLQRLFAATRRRRHAGLIVASAIAGKGGVGKTALAVHAAYQLQPQFPDGQLYVNLRGAERQALQPGDVLARLLRALGIPSALIPEGVDERAGLYRRRLSRRRMLIVLDNAADEAQVRPLLPGGGSSAVLITSRALLAGLDTAATIRLDVLREDEALDLLGKLLGHARVEQEPEAAKAISRLCGYLPLAVRIAGAKLNANPHLPLTQFAQQLADQHRRLDTLHVGDLDVRASFALSYQQLPADRQHLFRLLGLQEGPSIGVPAAKALLNQRVKAEDLEAEDLLDQLVDLDLLDRPILGRYQLHDLLRLFAHEQAISGEPESQRTTALQRLFTFYLATTQRADQRIRPGRPIDGELAESPQQLSFTDFGEAMRWLELERATLVSAVQQAAAIPSFSRIAGELANALRGFFELRSYFTDWEQTGEAALTAAKQDGDTRALATARLNLGIVAVTRHPLEPAMRLFEEALYGYKQVDDRLGQARALTSIGNLHRDQGQYELAARVLRKGLDLRRKQGDRHGEAVTLFLLGLAVEQRNHKQGLAHFRQSLALFGELGDRWGQLNVRFRLGVVYRAQGRTAAAITAFEETLGLSRELGHRGREADALAQLGLLSKLGRHELSVKYLEDALSVRRSVGDQYGEAKTLRHLGEVHWANGQYQQARVCWETARAKFDGVGAQRETNEVQALLAAAEQPADAEGSPTSPAARREGR